MLLLLNMQNQILYKITETQNTYSKSCTFIFKKGLSTPEYFSYNRATGVTAVGSFLGILGAYKGSPRATGQVQQYNKIVAGVSNCYRSTIRFAGRGWY